MATGIAVIDLNSTTNGTGNTGDYDQSPTTNPTVALFGNADVVSSSGAGQLDSITITANQWSGTESYGVDSLSALSGFSSTESGGALTLTYTGGGSVTDGQWTNLLDSITFTNTADVSQGSTTDFAVTGAGSANYIFGGDDVLTVICFCAGTMVATPAGEVAVENLKRGDLVLTNDGRSMPITWLGRQTVSRVFADPLRVLPIRIKAGALGHNVPSRDLLTSPDHAILVDGTLVQAGALVNGTTIVRETHTKPIFTYYHVELDDHSLILAENVPAETFIDNVDRLAFDNWAEHEALYPNGKAIVEMPYPRAKAHRQVPPSIRANLTQRAKEIDPVAGMAAVG